MDPQAPISGGICTWVAPLKTKVDDITTQWPKGAISGGNNGLLDAESYD